VILAAKIGQVLREPFHASRGNNGIDLYSIGRIYEINKDYEYSSRCYEEALNCDLTDEDSLEILRLCSYAYKKQGNWQRAERAWRDIISFSNEFILFPYEELAKYYEHRLKDYSRAINVVEDALTRLEQENLDLENKGRWMQELNYRLERIIRKSNACNQNSSGI
jgi:tetratricopeptide (TPR) repeat protein